MNDLVNQINGLHTQVMASVQTALDAAIDCGQLLIEAKEQLAHGELKSWIRENLSFSYETAKIYARLAKNDVLIRNWQKGKGVTFLSITDALEVIKNHKPKQISFAESEISESEAEIQETWKKKPEAVFDLVEQKFEAVKSEISELKTVAQNQIDLLLKPKKPIFRVRFQKIGNEHYVFIYPKNL